MTTISQQELETFVSLLKKLRKNICTLPNEDTLILEVDYWDVSLLVGSNWVYQSEFEEYLHNSRPILVSNSFSDFVPSVLSSLKESKTPQQKALKEAQEKLSPETFELLGLSKEKEEEEKSDENDGINNSKFSSYDDAVYAVAKFSYEVLSKFSSAESFTMQVDHETVTLVESDAWIESTNIRDFCNKEASATMTFQCEYYND